MYSFVGYWILCLIVNFNLFMFMIPGVKYWYDSYTWQTCEMLNANGTMLNGINKKLITKKRNVIFSLQKLTVKVTEYGYLNFFVCQMNHHSVYLQAIHSIQSQKGGQKTNCDFNSDFLNLNFFFSPCPVQHYGSRIVIWIPIMPNRFALPREAL